MMAHFDILVVCVGNLCRSPLVERLLRAKFDDVLGAYAGSVSVSSAGVAARAGMPMDPLAAAQLRRLGGDPDGFHSTRLRVARAEGADLVLAATKALRSACLEEAPGAFRRTFTIREFAALVSHDLPSNTTASAEAAPMSGPGQLVRGAWQRRAHVSVPDYDVPDPIGCPERVHREVADLLDTETTRIARAIAASWQNADAASSTAETATDTVQTDTA